jgi:hypothetical protein
MGRSAGQTEMDAVATYERKYERWERVVERANAVFVRQVMRTLRRPAVSIRISRSRRL